MTFIRAFLEGKLMRAWPLWLLLAASLCFSCQICHNHPDDYPDPCESFYRSHEPKEDSVELEMPVAGEEAMDKEAMDEEDDLSDLVKYTSSDIRRIASQLDLTEEQEEVVIPILEQAASDKKRIVEDNWGKGDLGPERVKEGLSELALSTAAELEEHLTEEQMADFRQIQAANSERFWQAMPKRGRGKRGMRGGGFGQFSGQGMNPRMGGRGGGRGGGGRGGY
jgi:hypothetical protein